MWDLKNNKEMYKFTGKYNPSFHSPTFSPNGKMLASGEGTDLKLWTTLTGQLEHTLENTSKGHYPVSAVAFYARWTHSGLGGINWINQFVGLDEREPGGRAPGGGVIRISGNFWTWV